MHTHTRAGAGVSLLQNGLRPISQDALQVYDDIAYHEYGVPASPEECDALGRTCKQGSHVVLLNHGLLTLGPTIHGTLFRMYCLERACELELIARTLGSQPLQIDEHLVAKAAERMRKRRDTQEYGLAEWQGLLRTVDRAGANYRC
jgi:ribulose-5-phosphate 4-epimerase/fuculose-1-phosphate aldolase